MKIQVYSTQMGQKEVETTATTWKELQSDLSSSGINFSKMKAVIGENKLTLEADGAILPTEGFTLFLMNKKTKAGADAKKFFASYKYGELRGAVRFILDKDPDTSDYFNGDKNYTTKSTDILRGLLSRQKQTPSKEEVAKFIADAKAGKKSSSKAPSKKVEPKKEAVAQVESKEEAVCESPTEKATNVADVVEDVKSAKETPTEEIKITHEGFIILTDSIKALKDVDFENVSTNLSAEFKDAVEELVSVKNDLIHVFKEQALQAKKEEEEKLAKEAEAKTKEEANSKVAEEKQKTEKDMKNQFGNLMSEFSDVRY